MRLKSHTKKIVAGALLVAFMFSYAPSFEQVPVAHAAAGLDPGDILSIPIKSLTEAAAKYAHTGASIFGVPIPFTSLDSLMKLAVKQIIEQLQKQVIGWVNNGNNGNPVYETNLGNFLLEVHDKTGSASINALSGDSAHLCGYFKKDVVTGLSTYFNTPGTSNVSSRGNCTAENQVGANKVNTFVNGDFQNGGGWDTWAAITQNDDSNPLGAYLTQQDNISSNISQKQSIEQQKLAWGNGFHSQEDANGNVVTPGTLIKEQTNSVLTSDLRQLEQAKTFDDIVTVLAQSLINGVINNKSGLRGSSSTGQATAKSTGKYLKPSSPTNTTSSGTTGINNTTDSGTTPTTNTKLQNVSIGGTATQSSTLGSHDAQVALTNYKNRDPAQGGLSMTEPQDNPWWQVDLGSEQPIDHIDITPRINDSYGNDLTDFIVAITQNEMGGNSLPPDGPGTWKSALIRPASPRSSITTITPPAGTIGRYIRIQEIKSGVRLEIAGVQVFAKAIPIVTLLGDNPLVVAKGSAFEDPGAVAIDQTDGDISAKMVISGANSVNTSVSGTYLITYSVTNSAGVSSGPLSRKVVVQ